MALCWLVSICVGPGPTYFDHVSLTGLAPVSIGVRDNLCWSSNNLAHPVSIGFGLTVLICVGPVRINLCWSSVNLHWSNVT